MPLSVMEGAGMIGSVRLWWEFKAPGGPNEPFSLEHLERRSLEANSRLLQQLADAHQNLLDIGCGDREQLGQHRAPSL